MGCSFLSLCISVRLSLLTTDCVEIKQRDRDTSVRPRNMKYGSTDQVSPEDLEKNNIRVEESEKILDYDDLVGEIGEFGLFQKIACFLLWFPAAAGGIHVMMYSFTGLEPTKYRCDIPGCNSTDYDGYIPEHSDAEKSCSFYQAKANADWMCEKLV